MTLHAAAALIVFALLQLWLVSSAISAGAPSALVVVALILLVALAVPTTRWMERRWRRLGRQAVASRGLHARFRRDVRRLWVATLTLPVLWVSTAMAATAAMARIAG